VLKSPSGTDLTGLALMTAGNISQGVHNRSLAHATSVPWLEKQWDPSTGLPHRDMPVLGEIRGAGAFFLGGACVRVHRG